MLGLEHRKRSEIYVYQQNDWRQSVSVFVVSLPLIFVYIVQKIRYWKTPVPGFVTAHYRRKRVSANSEAATIRVSLLSSSFLFLIFIYTSLSLEVRVVQHAQPVLGRYPKLEGFVLMCNSLVPRDDRYTRISLLWMEFERVTLRVINCSATQILVWKYIVNIPWKFIPAVIPNLLS